MHVVCNGRALWCVHVRLSWSACCGHAACLGRVCPQCGCLEARRLYAPCCGGSNKLHKTDDRTGLLWKCVVCGAHSHGVY